MWDDDRLYGFTLIHIADEDKQQRIIGQWTSKVRGISVYTNALDDQCHSSLLLQLARSAQPRDCGLDRETYVV